MVTIRCLIMLYISQDEMQRFIKKIVDLMRDEMLFSWQGGPIIMLQVVMLLEVQYEHEIK